jgi:Kef-type K+ transport system membrane component KefB
MNARGAMEIILATLALQANLIGEEVFVAIVIMAVITSIVAGPMMNWLLKGKTTADLT